MWKSRTEGHLVRLHMPLATGTFDFLRPHLQKYCLCSGWNWWWEQGPRGAQGKGRALASFVVTRGTPRMVKYLKGSGSAITEGLRHSRSHHLLLCECRPPLTGSFAASQGDDHLWIHLAVSALLSPSTEHSLLLPTPRPAGGARNKIAGYRLLF